MSKRNPGLASDLPVQGQRPRQQARFLLLVEKEMAKASGHDPAISLVTNPVTRAVMEVAGVPLDQLDGQQNSSDYSKRIDAVLKHPWQINKNHPHHDLLMAAKDAISSGECSMSCLESMSNRDDWQEVARVKFIEAMGVVSPLAWKSDIAGAARELQRMNGDLQRSGLNFTADQLRGMIHQANAAKDRADVENESLKASRRAEFKEQFGHQPSNDDKGAWLEEAMFVAYGRPLREQWAHLFEAFKNPQGFEDHFRGGSFNGKPSNADWQLLGLEPGSTQDQVKAAFRKLAKEHHPDCGGDAEQFMRVVQAAERVMEVTA